jgi:hypothetical protein
MNSRVALIALLALALAGCRATITDRLEIHSDGTATAKVATVMDDQFYNLAGNKWDDIVKESDGWHVTRSTDDNENHRVDASRELGPLDEHFADQTSTPGLFQEARATWDNHGLMRTLSVSATLPAIKIPTDKTAFPGSEDMAKQMASNVVALRLNLLVPGTVTSTNGERQRDGSYQWTLSFTSPTQVNLTTEMPNVTLLLTIGVGAIVAGLVVVAAILILRSRRDQPAAVV